VLWRCWLGGRKGIRPVKNMDDGGGGHWLVRMEWRPAGWSVCLSLLTFPCTTKSRLQKLSSGTGSPGWSWKKGHKTVVVVVVYIFRMGKAQHHKFGRRLILTTDYPEMGMSMSHHLFRFWKMMDNVSEMVQDRDIVTMEY